MGDRSKIEWTDATWNPTTGCTQVSTGCDNCYALTLAQGRLKEVYMKRLPVLGAEDNDDPFAVRLWPERLDQPARWRKPRMIFVNSMSDLFHIDIPEPFLRRVFEVMLKVNRHVYQVLTKRPTRAVRFFNRNRDLFPDGSVPAHIWIGTSIENQEASFRLRQLLQLPASVRFLSCEPLLGALQLNLSGIHWLIVGGESGIGYRSMDADWVREIREQCVAQRVPFFFKQWGGRTPKAKGRALDLEEWNQLPQVLAEGALAL